MRRQIRKLGFETLDARRALAVTAFDDAYPVAQNGELHIGYEKAGYQSLLETDILSFGNAAQLEFSGRFGLMLMRSLDGKSVKAIDVATHQVVSTHSPYFGFSDISLTADERYLFVADFFGKGWSKNVPKGHVHRFDCANRTWATIGAPVGIFKIEAVSENRVLLQEADQHVDITLNSFDANQGEMAELSRVSGHYEGDMEFDADSGTIFHVDRNIYVGEIQVRRILNDRIVKIQSTPQTVESGLRWGGLLVLSSDRLNLFYGAFQVEANDVSNILQVYSDEIIAASSTIAFEKSGNFYDSRNGKLLGTFDFPVGAIHVAANDRDVWVAEKGSDKLHRFLLVTEKQGILANDQTDPNKRATATLDTRPLHGSAIVNANGSFSYIPTSGFIGTDSFRYVLMDESGAVSRATVRLTVSPIVIQNRVPVARDLEFHIDRGGQLRIEQATGAYSSGARQLAEFPSPGNVRQIEYSTSTGLLAVRNTATKVYIIDPKTQRVVSEKTAIGVFTDMDLTPDGRYLMVADYVSQTHSTFLQVYDLQTNAWAVFNSTVAVCRVEAISAERVLTETCDGPVSLVLNSLSAAQEKLLQLDRFLVHYAGDFEYDNRTNQIYHLSTSKVYVFDVSNDRLFEKVEAEYNPYPLREAGSAVLSADGKKLYSGAMQIDAAYVRTKANVFRQIVYAASDELAFGENEIYDLSGSYVGKLEFVTDVHFVSDDSRRWWTFDPQTDRLRHYALDGKRVGLLATADDPEGDPMSLELLDKPLNGSLSLIGNKGSVLYVPKSGFVGIDRFQYRVSDGRQTSGQRTVTIYVDDPSPVGQAPKTVDDRFVISVGQQLSVGSIASDSTQIRKVSDFDTPNDVLQMAVSEHYGVIATATLSGVQLYDRKSNALINSMSTQAYVGQIEITPDERYLFAAEGMNYYASPQTVVPPVNRGPARIHRYDIVSRQWVTKEGSFGFHHRIEAISRNRILLLNTDSDATLYDFTDDSPTPLLELDKEQGFCDLGDAEYDWRTRQVYCGDENGARMTTIQITGAMSNALENRQLDRVDNYTATSGKSSTLSSDGNYFYHGGMQVKLGVRPFPLRLFPERILAATSEFALGANGFYDSENAQLVQALPRPVSSAFANALGTNMWLGTGRSWQQWQTIVDVGVLANDLDSDNDVLRADVVTEPEHGVLNLRSNGSFTYTPRLGFSGTDTFSYVASSSDFQSRPTNVTIDVLGTWHNAINGLDVNSDGNVSPLDVLLLINVLNRRNDFEPLNAFVGFLDVDNDKYVSPIDALLIVNYLNNPKRPGSGERPAMIDQFFTELDAEGEQCFDSEMNCSENLSPKNRLKMTALFYR